MHADDESSDDGIFDENGQIFDEIGENEDANGADGQSETDHQDEDDDAEPERDQIPFDATGAYCFFCFMATMMTTLKVSRAQISMFIAIVLLHAKKNSISFAFSTKVSFLFIHIAWINGDSVFTIIF